MTETKPKPSCNIGERPIKPLGRGPDGASLVVLAEVAALRAYGKDCKNLPPADSNEHAKQHRTVAIRHAKGEYLKNLISIFRGLGLDY